MDILLKNMEMPKEGHYYLEVFCDGEIRRLDNISEGFRDTEATAVALPSHGRLIVADALLEKLEKIALPDDLTYTIARGILKQIVEDASTIVEATE